MLTQSWMAWLSLLKVEAAAFQPAEYARFKSNAISSEAAANHPAAESIDLHFQNFPTSFSR